MDGTSMAPPFVTGVMALLKSKNSQYASRDLANNIKSNVKSLSSLKRKVSSNRVDLFKVLSI